MIAMKMIEVMDRSASNGSTPRAWRVRDKTLAELRRQSRHTGDVRWHDGRLTFLDIPIELGDVRNALGAELLV